MSNLSKNVKIDVNKSSDNHSYNHDSELPYLLLKDAATIAGGTILLSGTQHLMTNYVNKELQKMYKSPILYALLAVSQPNILLIHSNPKRIRDNIWIGNACAALGLELGAIVWRLYTHNHNHNINIHNNNNNNKPKKLPPKSAHTCDTLLYNPVKSVL